MPARPTLTPAQAQRQTAEREALTRALPTSGFAQVEVVAVTPGAASDGNARCVVNWLGAEVAVPYLAGYSPTVGDVVELGINGSQLLVRDRIIGAP